MIHQIHTNHVAEHESGSGRMDAKLPSEKGSTQHTAQILQNTPAAGFASRNTTHKQPPLAVFHYECFGYEVGLDVLDYSGGTKLYNDVLVNLGFYSKRSIVRIMWALARLLLAVTWRDLSFPFLTTRELRNVVVRFKSGE